ncbi:unnamed protein product [Bathycoccus prasinos]
MDTGCRYVRYHILCDRFFGLQSETVTRKLVVIPSCPPGEVACINTPCSVDGVCLEDVELQTFIDAEEEAQVADPPIASVITYEGFGSSIQFQRQYTPYYKCDTDQIPTALYGCPVRTGFSHATSDW